MIYVLFVVYNTAFIPKEQIDKEQSSFRFVLFDNSTEEAIREENRKSCLSLGIFYETENANVGLSKAYNAVIRKYLQKDEDWLLIQDADSSLGKEYYSLLQKEIRDISFGVYSPINVDKKDGRIDSPRRIRNSSLFATEEVDLEKEKDGFFMSINNGLLIKKTVFDQIGLYDERIFLYFTDSYFFFMLREKGIKTRIINFRNMCDFSFSNLDHKKLKKKLGLMKKDGKTFYSIAYHIEKKPILGFFHYHLFFLKKAWECAKQTKKRYFLSYLFTRKAKI